MGKNIKNLWIGNPEKFLQTIKVNKIDDMVKFVGQYNINVGVFPVCVEGKAVMPNNMQSYIMIKNDVRMIGVRADLSLKTQRFMIAYLFSSYILKGNDDLFADSVYHESIYDSQIYDYMLSLVMPDVYFQKMFAKFEGNTAILADTYGVNEVVIEEKINKIKNKSRGEEK